MTSLEMLPQAKAFHSEIPDQVRVPTALGEGVDQWNVGDEVMGPVTGGMSSHVVASANNLVRKPDNLSFEEAYPHLRKGIIQSIAGIM